MSIEVESEVQKGENAHRLQMALPKPADAPVTSAVSFVIQR